MANSEQHDHAYMTATARTKRIRALNDAFRRTLIGGCLVCTSGIQQFDPAAIKLLLHGITTYEAFTPDNDPHGEHDFGSLSIAGQTVFWKIDYYDRGFAYGSPDPANPAVTTRVLTIMLASEFIHSPSLPRRGTALRPLPARRSGRPLRALCHRQCPAGDPCFWPSHNQTRGAGVFRHGPYLSEPPIRTAPIRWRWHVSCDAAPAGGAPSGKGKPGVRG